MFKVGDKVRFKAGMEVRHHAPAGAVFEVLEVPERWVPNLSMMYIKSVNAVHGRERMGFWFNRFELVPGAIIPAPVPLTKENAVVGMKVRVVNVDNNPNLRRFLGQVVTIHRVSNTTISLEETAGFFKFHRFVIEPVAAPEPIPAVPVAGKKVRCIDGDGSWILEEDEVYTVKTEHANTYLLAEIPGKLYAKRRFEDVAPAVAPAPKPIQVGDMVYVVAKVEAVGAKRCQWDGLGAMDMILNNGVAYEVKEIRGDLILLNNRWHYLAECLSHNPPGMAAPAPFVPPPKAPPAKLDVVEEIRTTLRAKEAEEKRDGSQIVSFAIKRVDVSMDDFEDRYGQSGGYYINPACYAPVNYSELPVEVFILDSSKHVRDYKQDIEDLHTYLKWLFNVSPWAPCFTTKGVLEALDKGVVMNCNRPIGELVGAATAFREAIEFKPRMAMFIEMVKAGYHGNTAYLMMVSFTNNGGRISRINEAGHCALTTNIEKDSLISFFKNGYADMKQKAANAEGATRYYINKWIGDEYGGNPFRTWMDSFGKITGRGWDAVTKFDVKGMHAFANALEPLVNPEIK